MNSFLTGNDRAPFYHRIEISELQRMIVRDYDRKEAVFTVKRKNENDYSVRLFLKTLQEQISKWLDEYEYFEREKDMTIGYFYLRWGARFL